ncbi:hypothetical protein RM788_28790 [Umezawaea sp. Da 62-37]|nr:hypothetical protein [Umezawaea sp. Da 62-37]WNV82202.1 hypothetical protein RM788_28790 [Umezawaea sp. Da 62-37]
MPAVMRSTITSRSNWANIARSWTNIRPIGSEVSNGSVADRNATPALSSSPSRLTVSRRLRENLSTRYTNRTSIRPDLAQCMAFCKPGRLVFAPDASSLNVLTIFQPGWDPS